MNVTISFGLFDTTAKLGSTPAVNDSQPWTDIDDLTLEGVSPAQVATLEGDYWRLDGGFYTFPDAPEVSSWGWWSRRMSDGQGRFDVPLVLIVIFSELVSSNGLSLEFNPYGPDYPSALNVAWYNDTALLGNADYMPNSWRYPCIERMDNYNRLVITFSGTSKPYRYLKLQKINFGIYRVFEGDEITAAAMLEEIDPISSEISINTLDFALYSANREFNILNPQGIYKLLQKKQSLRVMGVDAETETELGTYYLDTWENEGEYKFVMTGKDAIGLMDETQYKGGIYNNYPAVNLLGDIITSAGFGYNVDPSFAGVTVSGWLPILSHREALQRAAFAVGAAVDDSRGDAIRIYPINDIVSAEITKQQKFSGGTVKLRSLVTGVELLQHRYSLSGEISELYKGELQAGINELTFSEPVANIAASNGTIVAQGANYVQISMTADGETIVTGNKYIDTTKLIAKYMPDMPAGEKQNILSIKEATLSTDNPQAIVDRVYDYCQRRIEQSFRLILGNHKVGQKVDVETLYDEMRSGTIEKLEIDMVGGFMVQAVIAGE